MQSELNAVRTTFQKYPMIPALKQAIAHWSEDGDWARVRPPLVGLGQEQSAALIRDLRSLGFTMPGLARKDKAERAPAAASG